MELFLVKFKDVIESIYKIMYEMKYGATRYVIYLFLNAIYVWLIFGECLYV